MSKIPPPPTKFGKPSIQSKATVAAKKQFPPPPTRFSGPPTSLQAKPIGPSAAPSPVAPVAFAAAGASQPARGDFRHIPREPTESIVQMMRGRNARKNAPSTKVKKTKTKQKSAKVKLKIDNDEYDGKSSGQYGHAEMEALRKFILDHTSLAVAAASLRMAATRTVECHNQPVCGSCRLVLKKLGFSAADTATIFSKTKSGGVAWRGNLKVKEFMDHLGYTETYNDALVLGAK